MRLEVCLASLHKCRLRGRCDRRERYFQFRRLRSSRAEFHSLNSAIGGRCIGMICDFAI
jgi:hypothetical protein